MCFHDAGISCAIFNPRSLLQFADPTWIWKETFQGTTYERLMNELIEEPSNHAACALECRKSGCHCERSRVKGVPVLRFCPWTFANPQRLRCSPMAPVWGEPLHPKLSRGWMIWAPDISPQFRKCSINGRPVVGDFKLNRFTPCSRHPEVFPWSQLRLPSSSVSGRIPHLESFHTRADSILHWWIVIVIFELPSVHTREETSPSLRFSIPVGRRSVAHFCVLLTCWLLFQLR